MILIIEATTHPSRAQKALWAEKAKERDDKHVYFVYPKCDYGGGWQAGYVAADGTSNEVWMETKKKAVSWCRLDKKKTVRA
ncbi:MAG: hypothetical protein F6K48_02890 [Okeania sp. SIO3H1]|nr:hypothetical protein [Okeania sp. SIO3H1]